jgi:hypothetical protein
MHRCLALPAPIGALVLLRLGVDHAVADQDPVHSRPPRRLINALSCEFKADPAGSPAREPAPQVTDQGLQIGREALRVVVRPPRTVQQPEPALFLEPLPPGVHDCRDVPYRASTSPTGDPDSTSSTARYRYSANASRSTRHALPRSPARPRRTSLNKIYSQGSSDDNRSRIY